jgi:hypothetical protein
MNERFTRSEERVFWLFALVLIFFAGGGIMQYQTTQTIEHDLSKTRALVHPREQIVEFDLLGETREIRCNNPNCAS